MGGWTPNPRSTIDIGWQDHITTEPAVCHGRACLRATRIMLSVVLDNLAAGTTPEEILANYPSLTAQATQAAMTHAADLAREHVVAIPA